MTPAWPSRIVVRRQAAPRHPVGHFISLFSGAGGMDLGFVQHGFLPAVAMDTSTAALTSYRSNLPKCSTLHESIVGLKATTLLESLPPEILCGDMPIGVIGGPPCQGFSFGNVAATIDDPRNQLPFEYARLLKELRSHLPVRFFLMENVLGLRQARHRGLLSMLIEAFECAGFHMIELTVEGEKLGLAQTRKRIVLLGLDVALWQASNSGQKILHQIERCAVNVRRNLRDVIGGLPDPVYFIKDTPPSAIPLHPNHWTMQPKSHRFSEGNFEGCTRSFRCLSWDQPSPTVAYGNREIHVHPDKKRRLSVFEAMLIQGFPKSFQVHGNLSDQIKQVCNAVPPPMIAPIARALHQLLKSEGRAAAYGNEAPPPRRLTSPAISASEEATC